ncbi:hypothetical protein FRD01_11300 [Microvenator marinus]|uniref:Uncharacterized protein n=1 Tax=Microvenator marinus TaxID=2600177 RepID=A0A5B8XWG5_9DELT|nr:hypothetical protein [Microvenator marinus]QED27809.1 hypothetical protein FRD01_11300 [Microvenator marinus]
MKKLTIATLILIGAGCQSQITGNEGNLVFSYTADDNLTDFNKPVALGAKLDLRVREAGTNLPVTISQAFSEDSDILNVETHTDTQLTVAAGVAGNTLIEVEATNQAGDLIADSVNMRADEATKLDLRHSCLAPGVERGRYLANSQRVFVPYDMFTERDEPAIGYGLFPIEFAPEGAAALDTESKSQSSFFVDLGDVGTLTMSSTLDDEKLEMVVTDVGEVDGATIAPGFENVALLSGQNGFVLVAPSVGEEILCQAALTMNAESLTPEVCEVVVPGDYEDSEKPNESLFLRVEGLSTGTCEFEVTFPDGNAGAGAATTLSVQIGEI